MQQPRIRFTLKVWPAVTIVTIGLCYLTWLVAGWFGIDLPDQQNVEVVKQCLENAFASPRQLLAAILVLVQILVLAPVLEELLFRGLLFKIPCKGVRKIWPSSHSIIRLFEYSIIAFSSALFSASHYYFQPWPDSAFLALFFFGLAQCWVYRKTDRIGCAMLDHGLFNLTNLVLLFAI